MIETYPNFDAAYRATLRRLLDKGRYVSGVASSQSIGSNFGTSPRPFVELQGDGFRLSNPRARFLASPARMIDPVFAAANFVFTISGGHEPQMITAYNSRGQAFAEDSSRYETAFGSRLFSPGHQIAYVKKKLMLDRQSRRAVAQIYGPDDTLLDRRDTPCAISLQFLIRDERLDCVCFMRSQSAVMVMPYDVFLFTMIQEWLAVEIGVPVGEYSHVCGSLHYYEEDKSIFEGILSEKVESEQMAEMTSSGADVANRLVEYERILRYNRLRSENVEPILGLDRYWSGFLHPIVDFHSKKK